jgi:HEAT repeat protein
MEEVIHPTGPSKSIEHLLASLSDKHGATRQEAREALVALGEESVPGLERLLFDKHDQTRWEAAKALCEIHSPHAAPALVTTLEDREFGIRWLAAEGLVSTGIPALQPLLEALCERPGSQRLREGAHHVLKAVHDPHFSHAVHPVLVALEGFEPDLTVGPAAKAALEGWPGTPAA